MKLGANLDAVRGAIRSSAITPSTPESSARNDRKPVITVSREAGIDVGPFVAHLVEHLNKRDAAEQDWVGYDRELVERVAADHQIEERLVASLDEHDKSWFEHFTAGLVGQATGTDIAIKTARTIRGLARLGRAVIVGRGGQCILQGFEHAVHVRLVAPLAWRSTQHASHTGRSPAEAEKLVKALGQECAGFIKTHFGSDVNDVSLYHVVINVKRVTEAQAGAMIAALVKLA